MIIPSPLQRHLTDDQKSTAAAFAQQHDFSEWSVRHWARGDKIPNPEMQDRIEVATGGKVTPSDWASFAQARRAARQAEAPAQADAA